jgi:hypothetical protein
MHPTLRRRRGDALPPVPTESAVQCSNLSTPCSVVRVTSKNPRDAAHCVVREVHEQLGLRLKSGRPSALAPSDQGLDDDVKRHSKAERIQEDEEWGLPDSRDDIIQIRLHGPFANLVGIERHALLGKEVIQARYVTRLLVGED